MEIEDIETTPAVAEFNTTQIIAEAALRGVVYAIAFTVATSVASYGIMLVSSRAAKRRVNKMNTEATPLTVVQ